MTQEATLVLIITVIIVASWSPHAVGADPRLVGSITLPPGKGAVILPFSTTSAGLVVWLGGEIEADGLRPEGVAYVHANGSVERAEVSSFDFHYVNGNGSLIHLGDGETDVDFRGLGTYTSPFPPGVAWGMFLVTHPDGWLVMAWANRDAPIYVGWSDANVTSGPPVFATNLIPATDANFSGFTSHAEVQAVDPVGLAGGLIHDASLTVGSASTVTFVFQTDVYSDGDSVGALVYHDHGGTHWHSLGTAISSAGSGKHLFGTSVRAIDGPVELDLDWKWVGTDSDFALLAASFPPGTLPPCDLRY